MLGIRGLMTRYRGLFRPLLIASGKTRLTASSFLKLFGVCWSPVGTNQREEEEAVILGWKEYVRGVEGDM